MKYLRPVALMAVACSAHPAHAQRTQENAVTAAQDAFGVSVGSESIGLYDDRQVRGFSPVDAGNVRLEGIYIALEGQLNDRLIEGNSIHVGLASFGYPFPAPTGIVDFHLRSIGDVAGLSLLVQGGLGGEARLELDGRVPVNDKLSLGLGAGYRVNERKADQFNREANLAFSGRWQPSADVEIQPFLGWAHIVADKEPVVFTAGNYLPPSIDQTYFGQSWADDDKIEMAYGLIGRATLTQQLTLRAGAFRSTVDQRENYSDLYRATAADGMAEHTIVATPEQDRSVNSGEVRLTNSWTSGNFSHQINLAVRARQGASNYGGAASAYLGEAEIGVPVDLARPNFVFGPLSRNEVSQLTGGINYEGRYANFAQISVGLQKARYSKTVLRPDTPAAEIQNSPWLYNGLLSFNILQGLSVFGSYTRGLEENGIAPNVAVNRGEPLPAAITKQTEAGLRYVFGPTLRLVAGVFDLRKPYFSLNSSDVFTQLGSLTNRGVEVSIAGEPMPGLNIVAGIAEMDPQVTGPDVENGLIGKYPVAQTRRLVRINLNYRPPNARAFSLDAGIEHTGSIAAASQPNPEDGGQLFIPARTTLDLGGRYRFDISGSPAVLRLQVQNVTGVKGWSVTPSGGFNRFDPRKFRANLAIDF